MKRRTRETVAPNVQKILDAEKRKRRRLADPTGDEKKTDFEHSAFGLKRSTFDRLTKIPKKKTTKKAEKKKKSAAKESSPKFSQRRKWYRLLLSCFTEGHTSEIIKKIMQCPFVGNTMTDVRREPDLNPDKLLPIALGIERKQWSAVLELLRYPQGRQSLTISCGTRGESPLMFAIRHEAPPKVYEKILASPVGQSTLQYTSSVGETAAMYAVRAKNVPLLRKILMLESGQWSLTQVNAKRETILSTFSTFHDKACHLLKPSRECKCATHTYADDVYDASTTGTCTKMLRMLLAHKNMLRMLIPDPAAEVRVCSAHVDVIRMFLENGHAACFMELVNKVPDLIVSDQQVFIERDPIKRMTLFDRLESAGHACVIEAIADYALSAPSHVAVGNVLKRFLISIVPEFRSTPLTPFRIAAMQYVLSRIRPTKSMTEFAELIVSALVQNSRCIPLLAEALETPTFLAIAQKFSRWNSLFRWCACQNMPDTFTLLDKHGLVTDKRLVLESPSGCATLLGQVIGRPTLEFMFDRMVAACARLGTTSLDILLVSDCFDFPTLQAACCPSTVARQFRQLMHASEPYRLRVFNHSDMLMDIIEARNMDMLHTYFSDSLHSCEDAHLALLSQIFEFHDAHGGSDKSPIELVASQGSRGALRFMISLVKKHKFLTSQFRESASDISTVAINENHLGVAAIVTQTMNSLFIRTLSDQFPILSRDSCSVIVDFL